MATLRLILGDQLTESLDIIQQADVKNDIILMAEVREEATYVKHHKKKIAFLFSAMRHYARHLEALGLTVCYKHYDDADNRGSLFGEVEALCAEHQFETVAVTEPAEYRLLEEVQTWQQKLGVPVVIYDDTRFISSPEEFSQWAAGKKQLRMEFFYREMRKKTNVLMDGKQPVGGKWNYDSDNRGSFKGNELIPPPTRFAADEITNSVCKLVETHFCDHFGDIEPFHFAVTRDQALVVLDEFITHRLANFGQYQDAMKEGDVWLYHSHLSFYLNCGLLLAKEVIQAVEQAYHAGQVPLNSAEGFIRQVLGWREYVRGFYWYFMPQLVTENQLGASLPLPEFFWHGYTNMNCMRQCIKDTQKYAYAHHIQRLMVVGNFALLTGLDPKQVHEWYLLVYADAYEWIELPNVAAMILFADGGKLASKPYAASGSYINKMSDYCNNCGYKVAVKTGPKACPFNYLYWDFLQQHESKFSNNPRMAMIYRTYAKMSEDKRQAIKESALIFKQRLANNEEV